ncbi:hypothetical protein P152DRAFT_388994 [Eremomyces bilateralis CBS 781.70]|uniref:Acyl-coenzyme A diphosphatase SCS3 n=1 Tax=Eremomyces bilateralis CBS 781.70 TaxID=1392243 RepID=A0A6G1GEI7_9PEZI|nr:uncharacterized protein P152DRAFT_388994 [Eremomyces bilateralis CBS 781.70]KAF1816497.1 hypothetical protein P152DRAFT_388994 [Eremomyces bilateralis CBS 781.70]
MNGRPPSLHPTTKPPSPPPILKTPLLPTPNELLLLSIYPITLLLGHLYSLLSPTTRHLPYDPVAQSHPAAHAPSYFARKNNLLNLLFVKLGWLWTTVVLALFVATHPRFGVGGLAGQVVLRWAGSTGVWYLVTQWCFGPGLVDRSFALTGGRCQVLKDPVAMEEMGKAGEVFTRVACKAAGGQWRGGHDISGHVFMLVLGSAMVAAEVAPAVVSWVRLVRDRNGVTTTMGSDGQETDDSAVSGLGVKAAAVYLALSWWMLLMTALYFHTWFEKLTGLIIGLAGFWLIYYLPRGMAPVRAIVGMPGL